MEELYIILFAVLLYIFLNEFMYRPAVGGQRGAYRNGPGSTNDWGWGIPKAQLPSNWDTMSYWGKMNYYYYWLTL